MKDALIGIVSGLAAVILATLLRPAAPAPRDPGTAVRQVPAGDALALADLTRRYLPSTRPDPAAPNLDRPVDGRKFRGARLDNVLGDIATQAGLNLQVDWRALEAAGINPEAPVALSLGGQRASEVLKAVLYTAGGGNIALDYRLRNGIVQVSTVEELSKDAVTRVYDIRDLIDGAVIRALAWKGLLDVPSEPEAADALIRVLQDVIDPTTWRDAGGTIGGIRYFYGRLVVTQTPENHDAVVGVLGALRAFR